MVEMPVFVEHRNERIGESGVAIIEESVLILELALSSFHLETIAGVDYMFNVL